MSLKNALVGIIAIGGLILMMNSPEKKITNDTSKYVFETLDTDTLKEFSIKSKDNTVTLSKSADGWLVGSLDNFKADEEVLSAFLNKALALKTGVRVSSGKSHFAKFGLDEGTLLEFKSDDSKVMSSAVFGDNRMSKSGMFGSSPNGQYMRSPNDEVIYLLKDAVSLKTSSEDWISKKLPSVSAFQIQAMLVKADGMKSVALTRLSTSESLTMQGVLPEEEVKTQELTQFTKSLENFSFASVAKLNSEKVTKSQTVVDNFEVRTFDGLVYNFKIGKKVGQDPHHWSTLVLSHVNGSKAIQDKVTSFNKQWADWAFALPAYSATSLLKKRSDLIQKKEAPVVEKPQESGIEYGAKHILLAYKGATRSSQTRSKEDALKLANEIVASLKKGEAFEDLAKKHSDDVSNKAKGGDLGTFGPKMMVPAFETATSLLKVGSYTSQPVETPFGYHLIKRTK